MKFILMVFQPVCLLMLKLNLCVPCKVLKMRILLVQVMRLNMIFLIRVI